MQKLTHAFGVAALLSVGIRPTPEAFDAMVEALIVLIRAVGRFMF